MHAEAICIPRPGVQIKKNVNAFCSILTNQRPLEGFGQFPLQPTGKILIVFKIMQYIASVGYIILEEKNILRKHRKEEKNVG